MTEPGPDYERMRDQRVDDRLLEQIAVDPRFNTKLTPAQEAKFQEWKAKYAPNDSGWDYDFRGAFLAGFKPDPKTHHWDDKFKKPNHSTFSTFSKYAKDYPELAGTWKDGKEYVPAFAPTPTAKPGTNKVTAPYAGTSGMTPTTGALPTAGGTAPGVPNHQDMMAMMAAFLPMLTQQQQGAQAPPPAVVGGGNPAQVLMGPTPPMGAMPQMPGHQFLVGPGGGQ